MVSSRVNCAPGKGIAGGALVHGMWDSTTTSKQHLSPVNYYYSDVIIIHSAGSRHDLVFRDFPHATIEAKVVP